MSDKQPKQMQWRRTRSDGGLDLYVNDGKGFKHYTQSVMRQPDRILSGKYGKSSYGFTTMQACLKAGYEYLDVSEEDKKKGDEL